jgi:hypothetical protein
MVEKIKPDIVIDLSVERFIYKDIFPENPNTFK